MNLEELKKKVKNLRSQREEKRKAGLDAITAGDLKKAKELRDEVSAIDTDIEKTEEEIELIEELQQGGTEEANHEPEAERNENNEPEAGVIDKANEKRFNKRQNPSAIVTEKRTANDKQRKDFRNFLLTGEQRALTTTSNEIIIPEDVKNEVIDLRTNDVNALDTLVTVKKVTTAKGSQPVLSVENDMSPLPTVAELEANPELALVPLSNIDYVIQTYRGYVRISREALEDAIGAEQMIVEFLKQKETNTRNSLILTALNGLAAKTATTADELKTLINTGINGKYKSAIIMSQTVYNRIDLLKDGNGRYLFEDSIVNGSGTVLFGLPVKVYDDEIIGKDTMYIGDMKQAVVLFDRSQYTAKWTDYMHYGECLMIAVRLDGRLLNPNAVVKVTFGAETVPAG